MQGAKETKPNGPNASYCSSWQVFFRYQSWSALLLWSPTFILQITIDIHRLFGSALSPRIKALWMFNVAGVGLTAAGWWAWFQELKPWTSSHVFTYSHCSFAPFCTWTCWTCWKQKEWTQSLWGAAYLMDLIIQLAVALWRTGTSWKSRTEGTVWPFEQIMNHQNLWQVGTNWR